MKKKKSDYIRLYLRISLRKFFSLLRSKINFKTYIILASLGVGILSGLAAVFLKHLVHFFQDKPAQLLISNGLNFLLPVIPLAGILLSVLIINFFWGGIIYKNLSNIIYLILRKNSSVPRREMISNIITSALTVGFGGSAGLEAPIVMTGAAIGSNTAKQLGFNYQTRTLLLGCGSAAGISAIFNSPIAGVIFAFEVLLPEFSIPSLIPLLISSASAAVVSQFLYGGQLFFLVTEGWELNAIPFYVVLGILCGVISLYFIKISVFIYKASEKIKHTYSKAITGGLILCILIFLIPSLYGEGYTTVINLLSGNYNSIVNYMLPANLFNEDISLIIWAGLIILFKVFATSITIDSGGNGGVIAPSLFTGAVTGFFLTRVVHLLGFNLINGNFIVVGMAGLLSGVLHSPLTGIFLIAEVTGGYMLIVPLMIVSALSFFISRFFHPHSIYTASLVERGINFRSEQEKYFLRNMEVKNLVERNFIPISPQATLRDVISKIKLNKRSMFPVIDQKNKLVGILSLNDIKEVMLDIHLYDMLLVYEIMDSDFKSVDINTDITKVLDLFKERDLWNIAVTKNGEYAGFISKSNFFNTYMSKWSTLKAEEL